MMSMKYYIMQRSDKNLIGAQDETASEARGVNSHSNLKSFTDSVYL